MQNKTFISKQLRQYADSLSVYGIVARYPNEVQIDDGRTRLALQYAEYILKWVKDLTE